MVAVPRLLHWDPIASYEALLESLHPLLYWSSQSAGEQPQPTMEELQVNFQAVLLFAIHGVHGVAAQHSFTSLIYTVPWRTSLYTLRSCVISQKDPCHHAGVLWMVVQDFFCSVSVRHHKFAWVASVTAADACCLSMSPVMLRAYRQPRMLQVSTCTFEKVSLALVPAGAGHSSSG